MNTHSMLLAAVGLVCLSAGCAVEGQSEGAQDNNPSSEVSTEQDALFEGRKVVGTYRMKFKRDAAGACITQTFLRSGQVSGVNYELKRDGTYSKSLFVCDANGAHCRDMSVAEARAGMNTAGTNEDLGDSAKKWSHDKVREYCAPTARSCPARGLRVTLDSAAGSEELHAYASWSRAGASDLVFETANNTSDGDGIRERRTVLRASLRGGTPSQDFDACAPGSTYINP